MSTQQQQTPWSCQIGSIDRDGYIRHMQREIKNSTKSVEEYKQQTTNKMSTQQTEARCEICDRNAYHQNDWHCSQGLIGPKIKEEFEEVD